MPRCLMAKKWKAYSWPNRSENSDFKIDEVFSDGDSRESLGITVKQIYNRNNHHDQEHRYGKNEHMGVNIDQNSQEHQHQHQHPQVGAVQTDDEEIDVVGDADTIAGYATNTTSAGQISTQPCWSPHSPTAGATAPSPPPLNASGALYYNGKIHHFTKKILTLNLLNKNATCRVR